ncbi:MAG: hypothetical protein ACP5OR_06405 [Candidatus Dormibacteria bacterium]
MSQSRCSVCGAPLAPDRVGCFYCGSGTPSSSLADVKRLGLGNPAETSRVLAPFIDELSHLLPGRIHVKRSLVGGTIRSVQIELDDAHYGLEVNHGQLKATTALVSGGIALSHSTVPLAQWSTSLASSLQHYAILYGANPETLSKFFSNT